MSRIALIGKNSIAYINALLDIWNNGNCAVLIDWRIPLMTATKVMKETGASEYYIQKSILEKSLEIRSDDIKYITFNQDDTTGFIPDNIHNKFTVNYSKNEAVIYTVPEPPANLKVSFSHIVQLIRMQMLLLIICNHKKPIVCI